MTGQPLSPDDLRRAASELPVVNAEGMLPAHAAMVQDAIDQVGVQLSRLADLVDSDKGEDT